MQRVIAWKDQGKMLGACGPLPGIWYSGHGKIRFEFEGRREEGREVGPWLS